MSIKYKIIYDVPQDRDPEVRDVTIAGHYFMFTAYGGSILDSEAITKFAELRTIPTEKVPEEFKEVNTLLKKQRSPSVKPETGYDVDLNEGTSYTLNPKMIEYGKQNLASFFQKL